MQNARAARRNVRQHCLLMDAGTPSPPESSRYRPLARHPLREPLQHGWKIGSDVQHLALLDNLPHPVILEVDGFGPVLFCHGTPRDDNEIVLVDTRLAKWAEVFADVPDDVRTIVCGHTHMPFVRLVDRRLVVNPGSVGMPYGSSGAHWALLAGGSVTAHCLVALARGAPPLPNRLLPRCRCPRCPGLTRSARRPA